MSWWVLGHYVLSLWFSSLHIKKQCSGPCEGMHDCAPFVLEQSAYINCREFFCIEDLPLSLTHLFFFFFCRLHVSMNAWIPVLFWLIFHYQWLHIVLEVIEVCTFETIFFYCIYVCLIPHIILFQFFCFLIFGCFFFFFLALEVIQNILFCFIEFNSTVDTHSHTYISIFISSPSTEVIFWNVTKQ